MKRNDYKFLVVILMVVISLGCLALGFYYGKGTKTNHSLSFSTSNISSNIDYDPKEELQLNKMSDEDGLKQESYGIVLLENDSKYSLFYDVLVRLEKDNLQSAENIRIALFNMKDDKIEDSSFSGPIVLNTLTLYQNDLYSLNFYKLKAKEKKQIGIKAWISQNALDKQTAKISIEYQKKSVTSKSFYNIKGTIKDITNNNISNAKICVQFGSICTLSNTDGSFELKEVPNGNWLLSVQSDDAYFQTFIDIQNNGQERVEETENGFIISGKDVLETTTIDNIQIILNNDTIYLKK